MMGFSVFQIFIISVRYGNICDQSRKLTKIAPNFGRFPLAYIGGGASASQQLYPSYHACLPARHYRGTSHSSLVS